MDLILNFLLLHCGYLGALVYLFILSKHSHLEKLSYIKKQQEQAGAQTNQYHPKHQQWKPVLTFCNGRHCHSHCERVLDLDTLQLQNAKLSIGVSANCVLLALRQLFLSSTS